MTTRLRDPALLWPETDGRSHGAGHHAHVFLAADGGPNDGDAISRLVVAAPWAADRRARGQPGGTTSFRGRDEAARRSESGSPGSFRSSDGEPIEDGDPLLGPATAWTGRTPTLRPATSRSGDDPIAFINADVAAECARRGLPTPVEVHVLGVNVGPRADDPPAHLKLRFAVAIRGPVLLGRDSHSGGGLFHVACGEVTEAMAR